MFLAMVGELYTLSTEIKSFISRKLEKCNPMHNAMAYGLGIYRNIVQNTEMTCNAWVIHPLRSLSPEEKYNG